MSAAVKRAPLLAAVETAYYVGKRRPLAELSLLRRWLIRFAYFRTGWASDFSIECLGIYTDRNEAVEAANVPGGFMHALPVNASLPERNCRYREHIFPASEAAGKYRRASPDVEVTSRSQIEKVHRQACQVRHELNSVSS